METEKNNAANRKRLAGKVISLAFLLAWMTIIFTYSARNAVDSTAQSQSLGRRFGSIVVSGWNGLSEEQKQEFAIRWDPVVRKTAHVLEYTILGVLFMSVFITWGVRRGRAALFAFPSGVIYAATDEFHQLYVPGRAGMISDVGIDACGVLLGTLIVLGITALCQKKKQAD